MSDSLIEQVKRLAEAHAEYVQSFNDRLGMAAANENVFGAFAAKFDFPALLAHLERTQAVVDAARELWGIDMGDWYEVPAKHYEELVAALENLRSDNDGK